MVWPPSSRHRCFRLTGQRRPDCTATMKPVDLLAVPDSQSAPRSVAVFSTPSGAPARRLIACEQTGRVAYLMEIDPHYVDVICKRFQDFTGTKPVLEIHGRAARLHLT